MDTQLKLLGVATIDAWIGSDGGRFALAGVQPGPIAYQAVEATTGLDLIKLQLRILRGGTLERALPAPRGHAIAVRLTREDPERGFAPTAGEVELYRPPIGIGLRIAPAVSEGDWVGDTGERTLATVVAWARGRAEAIARLGRGLRETSLVVRGGATTKGCLLALCARLELARVDYDDGWLERAVAVAGGGCDDAHAEVALCAVAIAAYQDRRRALADQFFRTATRGRPRLGATGGHRITLHHRGAAYALQVAQIGDHRYRIDAGRGMRCDVEVDDRGQRERRLVLGDRRYRVRATAAAGRHAVEVDGVPHQVEVEDALGVIRAPSPAVVLRVLAAPGEPVRAGQPVVVLEAMKMEIVVAAPEAGELRELLVMPSVQVDLDAPLAIYDRRDDRGGRALPAGALVLPATAADSTPRGRFARAAAELQRLLLGYDADAGAARAILDGWRAAAAELPVDDPSDYAQLFTALGEVLRELEPLGRCDVLLSAGTPQMQTLWVILVEAGLLAARMLQVIPAAFVPDPHPSPIREVRLDIEGFPEIRAMREELVRLRAETRVRRSGRIGNSEAMRMLERRLARVARTQVPVLITGETGTGKELIARALHDASERAGGPFVAENCGSFSEGVLSSELFGHERGAFTGASGRRRGLFEQADRGTLFLDEIGETSPRVQVMLLRVLQEGRLRRVGGEDEVSVDVRVVAATHRDLRVEVEQGRFREDLYYRLCGAQLELPPLRERGRDLELLVRHFLAELGVPSLWPSEAAWAALRAHRWPGNVRELRAEVVRWSVFCERSVELDDLSPPIRAALDAVAREPATPREPSLAAGPVAASGPIRPLAEQVDATERRALLAALAACEGNLSAIARALAIDRNTLKRKLDKHGLRSSGP